MRAELVSSATTWRLARLLLPGLGGWCLGCIDFDRLYGCEGPGACGTALSPAVCGDGFVQPAEECDDGNDRDDDSCVQGCHFARCGDGFVYAGIEQCDDQNEDEADGCTSTCLACGKPGTYSYYRAENLHCYQRSAENQTRPVAEEACATLGGYLVAYASQDEADQVCSALLTGDTAPSWIGLRDENDGAMSYFWQSGDPVRFTVWAAGEPPAGDQDCTFEKPTGATACPGGRYGLQWHTSLCAPSPKNTATYRSLCEWSAPARSPDSGHGYLPIHRKSNFADAAARCEALGASLASINNSDEQAIVAAIAPTATYWLGAVRNSDGNLGWSDGVPFAYSPAGAATAWSSDDDCLFMEAGGRWVLRSCTQGNAYPLCEFR